MRSKRQPQPWISVKPGIIRDTILLTRQSRVALILLTGIAECVIGTFLYPSKIEDCRICMKRACDICIPKATRLCPVCALSIGNSQVPQHIFEVVAATRTQTVQVRPSAFP